MLNENDMNWLVQQIVGTSELLGQEIKPTAAAMLAEDLAGYPREVLTKAFARVRTEHTGRLTPKAILDRIDEAMGRPSANEAWAMALNALDERNTVVWTDEMSKAWEVASALAANRDMIGARMAFIGAYERLVRTAREERKLPNVTVSIGWNAEMRGPALEKAVQLGYLPQERARELMPTLECNPGFNPVALLTGNVIAAKDAPQEIRERLAKLRADLASSDERRRVEAERRACGARAEIAARKAETQRRVDAAMAPKEWGVA